MESEEKAPVAKTNLSRRSFVRTGIAAGTGLLLSRPGASQEQRIASRQRVDDLNIAIIGFGEQGNVLTEAARNIAGIRFKAVCDLWAWRRKYGQNQLRRYLHDCQAYEDIDEMLAAEKDLDAVIVATPDCWHAPHAITCMKAGLHVYCEKMMSNTREGAQAMVHAQRETGRLLQIGHQRRSNPRYLAAKQQIIDQAQLLGRITAVNGQWNRSVSEDLIWKKRNEIPESRLHQYGYANMKEFRNWRWYKAYGGGPISDLGAHQIDIYNWFLGTPPQAVLATGGVDYYQDKEWWDSVMAVYDYKTAAGMVRAFYQVQTTTRAGIGYYEYFMGTEGCLRMSEDKNITRLYREDSAPDWKSWERAGLITEALRVKKGPSLNELAWWDQMRGHSVVDARATADLDAFVLNAHLGDKRIHQPHLENFFDAIRKGTPLNCPADTAYETDITVMKVNAAIEQERKLRFEPSEFRV